MWILHVKTGDYTSMNSYKSFRELKQLARESLLGNYGTLIGATFIFAVFLAVFSLIVFFVVNPDSPIGFITVKLKDYFFFSFIHGIVFVGFNKMCLNTAQKRPITINQLFFGFRNHPDKAILIEGIFILFNILCSIPYEIVRYIFFVRSSTASIGKEALSVVFLSFIGSFIYYILTLRFALCFYLLVDEPQLTTMELLKKSTSMMKGQKKRCFFLGLSFFPWVFLYFLSFGIAVLWIMPYIKMTFTYFYLELREQMAHSDVQDIHSYYI